MTNGYSAFEVKVEGHVAEVTMLGPGKGNALGPEFWRECPEVFERLSKDDDVRAVLLYGKGESFTYGLDLKAMMPVLMPLVAPAGRQKRCGHVHADQPPLERADLERGRPPGQLAGRLTRVEFRLPYPGPVALEELHPVIAVVSHGQPGREEVGRVHLGHGREQSGGGRVVQSGSVQSGAHGGHRSFSIR